MPTKTGLWTLCERLRGEKLLVGSELETLQRLNRKFDDQLSQMVQLAWLSSQQQLVLWRLINSHPDATPKNSCKIVSKLECAVFVDGYQRLGHHDLILGQLLLTLMKNPTAIVDLLNYNDASSIGPIATQSIFDLEHIMFSLLYSSCVFPNDEKFVLCILKCLIRSQFGANSNPRRILAKGNCPLSKLYRLFSESLFSTKIFLTAALHDPVMTLLSQDDQFLDIDASKSVIRFPVDERRRRFGHENCDKYAKNVHNYRRTVVGKLAAIGTKFIDGIRQAMPCFPTSLAWLIKEVFLVLRETNGLTKDEATLICTDLLFTNFLCPAIANPEPLGIISDTPISYIARFNLMQVGQILQTLAVWPYEKTAPNLLPFYKEFDQQSMSNIVKGILNTDFGSLDDLFADILPNFVGNDPFERRIFVGTIDDIRIFHDYLSKVYANAVKDENSKRDIEELLKKMPANLGTDKVPENGGNLNKTPSPDFVKRRTFSDRVQIAALKGQRLLQPNFDINKVKTNESIDEDDEKLVEVLMIPLGNQREPLGLINEEKYLNSLKVESSNTKRTSQNGEKRTRFGNIDSAGTSDRTEEGVDGESRDSLSSSLEESGLIILRNTDNDNEDEAISTMADNLSDLAPVSADVSERASPSEMHPETEDDRNFDRPSIRRGVSPGLPTTIKENRENLEEQFGRFTLPPGQPAKYREDANSLVSDSWSTDVVPSEGDDGTAGDVSTMQPPGGIVPAGSLPDLIPADSVPRLDLIREEVGIIAGVAAAAASDAVVAAGGATVGASGPTVCTSGIALGIVEDRSDTWSVDAMASDSETDAANIGSDQLLLMIDDVGSETGSMAGIAIDYRLPETVSVEDSPTMLASAPVSDSRFFAPLSQNSVAKLAQQQRLFSAIASDNCKDHLRRQSSGSSFLSRSDVESEFSRDYCEDGVSSTFPIENTVQKSAPHSSNISHIATSNCGDSTLCESDSAVDHDGKLDGKNDEKTAASSCSSNESDQSGDDAKRIGQSTVEEAAKRLAWKESGAIPRTRIAEFSSRKPPQDFDTNSKAKKTATLFYGLQRMGNSLKNRRNLQQRQQRQQHHQQQQQQQQQPLLSRTFDDLSSLGNGPAKINGSQTEIRLLTAEEIIDKYASKNEFVKSTLVTNGDNQRPPSADKDEDHSNCRYYDPDNLAECRAFLDGKRKLRLVLSSVDCLPNSEMIAFGFTSREIRPCKNKDGRDEHDLLQFLRLLLAESINGQQKELSAQIREVVRCMTVFDNRSIRKLLRTLKEEHRKRASYLLYLQRSRLSLLQLQSYLEKLSSRIQR